MNTFFTLVINIIQQRRDLGEVFCPSKKVLLDSTIYFSQLWKLTVLNPQLIILKSIMGPSNVWQKISEQPSYSCTVFSGECTKSLVGTGTNQNGQTSPYSQSGTWPALQMAVQRFLFVIARLLCLRRYLIFISLLNIFSSDQFQTVFQMNL